MVFPTLGPSSLPVVVAQPDENMQTEQLLWWEWYDRHRTYNIWFKERRSSLKTSLQVRVERHVCFNALSDACSRWRQWAIIKETKCKPVLTWSVQIANFGCDCTVHVVKCIFCKLLEIKKFKWFKKVCWPVSLRHCFLFTLSFWYLP